MNDSTRQRWIDTLTRFFTGDDYESVTTGGLWNRFDIPEDKAELFGEVLRELERGGVAAHLDDRGWFSPKHEGWIVGTLSVTRRGHGFVAPAIDDGKGDIYISSRKLKDGHDGDLVLCKTGKPRRSAGATRGRSSQGGGKGKGSSGRHAGKSSGRGKDAAEAPAREGKVLYALQRSERVITGQFYHAGSGGEGVVEPQGSRHAREIYVPAASISEGLDDGARVLVRIKEGAPILGRAPGEILARCAPVGTWESDLQTIMVQFEFADEFPKEVERDAARLPEQPRESDMENREDRRGLPIVTIDPHDAKDFDDAITLTERPDGGYRLGVFIADVAHYVGPGTPIDREARRRATSVYLPGRVIPMIPEALSNGLCSLRPDEDRLAKGVWMDIAADGELESWTVERSVIRSRRRFAYSDVQELLDGAEPDEQDEEFVPMLRSMDRLRRVLKRRKVERGAIELALDAQRIVLDDQGEVETIGAYPRTASHNLVEEFMLLANEAVARACTQHEIPILRRVHAPPPAEDMDEFLRFCRLLVPELKGAGDADLQKILDQIKKKDVEPILNFALLRTLTRAEYDVSRAVHFALALEEYCHFTSPIRRYADLQVHRALDAALFGIGKGESPESLDELAENCSFMSRQAEEAEREMAKLRSISWLRPLEGERFHGMITSVRDFGFFVRLDDNLVEGLVHISRLRSDFFELDESQYLLAGRRSGKVFRLGDRVEVALLRTDSVQRHIDFDYVDHLSGGAPRGKSGPRSTSSRPGPGVKSGKSSRPRKSSKAGWARSEDAASSDREAPTGGRRNRSRKGSGEGSEHAPGGARKRKPGKKARVAAAKRGKKRRSKKR